MTKFNFSKKFNDYIEREFPNARYLERAKFRSVEKDVLEALRQGHKKTHIYKFLKSEQTLTCSYETFLRFLKESQETEKKETDTKKVEEKKPTKEAKEETTNRK